MAIDATVGGAGANSFGTEAEADAYFEGHLYASGWDNASSANREKALRHATRVLCTLPWDGARASATQALSFPRSGLTTDGQALSSTIVPNQIKWAEFEYAQALIAEDLTETNEVQKLGLAGLKAGPVELKFAKQLSQRDMDLPSNRAMMAMLPDAVRMLIPDEWLISVAEQAASENQEIVFTVL